MALQSEIRVRNEREEAQHALLDALPQFVWILRPDGSLAYANQRWRDYRQRLSEHAGVQAGLAPQPLDNCPQGEDTLPHADCLSEREVWLHNLHPEDRARVLARQRQAWAAGEPYTFEYRLRDGRTGAYRWFLSQYVPQRNAAGQIVQWVGTCTDIDDQKRTEEALRQSREELRVLMETMPQLVWIARPDGFLEYGNQRNSTYLNAPLERFNGDQWFQFVHPDDRQKTWTTWQTALRTGQSHEVEYRLREGKTGNYQWFLVRGIPFTDEQGHILKWFGTCTNIDEQKRTEEALRQSQERASALMNSSMIGIAINKGEQIVDANDTFLHMTGYTREDLRAGRLNWVHMTAPEDRDRSLQAYRELPTRQSITYEKEYVCKDGSRLPVLVCVVVLKHHPFQEIAFLLDNSARKELEQRKDAFLGMVSHELKTPLASLKLQAQLLRKKLGKQDLPNGEVVCARMDAQLHVIIRLVEELLDLSRIQAGTLEYAQDTVDLDELLEEVVEMMQGLHTTHTMVVRHASSPALVVGDRDRLVQAFLNVLSNAIKYAPDAPLIDVMLTTSAESVTISVRDQGMGIPRELQGKIFERFSRAVPLQQRAFPGLGMGLYIVSEIVKHHGGTIRVESEKGKGATFHLTFPLATARDEGSRG